MAEKNIDQQVAEKEAEIVKLKAEQEKLRAKAAHQEYPRWIADPTDEKGMAGRSVANAEEEKAVLASYEEAYAKTKKQRDLDKKIADLRTQHEKDLETEAEKARAVADRSSAAAVRASVAAAKGKK